MNQVLSISTFQIEPRWKRFYFSLRIPENVDGLLATVSGWNSNWGFGGQPSPPSSAGRLSLKGTREVFLSTEVDYDLGLIPDELPFRASIFPRIPQTQLIHRKRPEPIPIQIREGEVRGLFEDALNLIASTPQAYTLKLYLFGEEGGRDE